jgi:hypothetical protein
VRRTVGSPWRPVDSRLWMPDLDGDLMAMICPDCQQNLDNVPPSDPCPQCGRNRRSAEVRAGAALAVAVAVAANVTIGYNLQPGWPYQWRIIQRHLARLREQYMGVQNLGNVDMEENVHALFLALFHLGDWLHQDSSTPLSEPTVLGWINSHPRSLAICRAYANTWKHMKRNRPGALIAQIIRFESGPHGPTVTIGYRPWDQPGTPMTEIDALALAEQSEKDWRGLLSQHSIPIPN